MHSGFSWRKLWYFGMQQNYFLYVYFLFHYREYQKENVLKGDDLIKLVILTASSRTFLSGDGTLFYYFLLQVCSVEDCNGCWYSLVPLPWFALWHNQFYPPVLFRCKCQPVKKANNVVVLFMKIVWSCGSPKGSWQLPVVNRLFLENCSSGVYTKLIKIRPWPQD